MDLLARARSWLNALVMWINGGAQIPEEMFGTFGVERCTPLDEMYGADGLPAPAKPAAEDDPYADFFASP